MNKELEQENLSCGIDSNITGCRFSLYPMTDNFVDIILSSLEKTDISNIWTETDALSTVYRGKSEYVVDAVDALFINTYKEDVHMTIEGLFSKGCPGDSKGDVKMGIGFMGYEIVFGIWLMAATLAAYIILKPGVAIVTEVLAAVIEVLLGNFFGPMVIVSGIVKA